MSCWSASIFAAIAVLACVPPVRAAEPGPAVLGFHTKQLALSLFVRKLPVGEAWRPAPLRRTDNSGVPPPSMSTEFGARLRLTEYSSAYFKILKFRATVPRATQGVQAPSHTMLDRPRSKAITAGIKFAF